MKKTAILIISLFTLSISSCKKAYKCECTTTQTGYSNVSSRDISKTSKKNAEAICGNSTDVSTYNSGSSSMAPIVSSSSTNCELK